jgi:hypothetical protein
MPDEKVSKTVCDLRMAALEKSRKWDVTPTQIIMILGVVALLLRALLGDKAADRAVQDATAIMAPVARMAADFGYTTNSTGGIP